MGHHEHGAGNRRALAAVLALTAGFTVVEIIGGLLTGSLALLADAGHMLSDNLSLGLALFAAWLAQRPATPNKSFGYRRAEILAALANGVTLVAVSVWVFVEAYSRLREPPEVLGTPMLLVAALGLLVNATGATILYRSGGESLNVEGAMRHVFADALGSVGAIVAAAIIILTGWRYADPLISVAIGFLILGSSWKLLKDSTNILLEATPPDLDATEVGRKMASADGIVEVHDLHIWTITSGFPALSAHILVGRYEDCHTRRRELEDLLAREYGISHTTLQVDHVGDHHASLQTLRFPSYPADRRDAMKSQPLQLSPKPGVGERERLVRQAKTLAWLGVGWHGVEAAVAVGAGVAAGSIALVGFGADSLIESLAGSILLWRFAAARTSSAAAERRAQKLIGLSFYLIAAYVAFEAVRSLLMGARPEASWIGIGLAALTLVTMPPLAIAKARVGEKLGSSATKSEGRQNMLCAYLSAALLVGLGANALFGLWWADPVTALLIAGVAVKEGRQSWRGESCCTSPVIPGGNCEDDCCSQE